LQFLFCCFIGNEFSGLLDFLVSLNKYDNDDDDDDDILEFGNYARTNM